MARRPEEEDSAFSLLAEIESVFRRMIAGVFRFVFVSLPIWIFETAQIFFEQLWRFCRYFSQLALRFGRTGFFISVWLSVVFGPLLAALCVAMWDRTLSIALFALGTLWMGVGLVGSGWGFYRWRDHRALALWPKYEGCCYPVVTAVKPGGWAEQHGIQRGALVLEVDGQALRDATEDELRELLGELDEGEEPFDLSVFAGDEVFAIRVHPRTILGVKLKFPGGPREGVFRA